MIEFVIDDSSLVDFDGRVIEMFTRGERPATKWRIHIRHAAVEVFWIPKKEVHRVVIGDRSDGHATENIRFDIPEARLEELKAFINQLGLP